MGTDLLADVLGIAQLTLGPTHAGPDGGNDGWYTGELDGVSAKWKIAFAVRASFPTLKTKATQERDKVAKAAKAAKPEAILLCTSCNLSVTQTHEIERILGAGLKKGRCWPQSRLDHHLRNAPWVASLHFNVQFLPGFAPLDAASELAIANQQDCELLGRRDALRAAETFLAGADRVLMVIAPGGAGKSRFLRALHALAASSAGRSAWLRRVGQGTIEDAILRGLPRKRPLLLCMDDACHDEEEALDLARLSKLSHGGIDAKVVLAGRAPDQFVLEKICRDAAVSYQVLPLEALGEEFARELARLEYPELSAEGIAALLRFSGGNLFILREAAQLLASGMPPSNIIDQEYLRGVLVDRLVREAVHLLSPQSISESDAKKLLLQTALDVPIAVLHEASNSAQETLRIGRILRVVGSTLRFRADVEGDLLLAELTREPWAQGYVRRELEADPARLPERLRNLAAAGQGYPAELVKQTLQEWIAHAATATVLDRLRIMKILPYAAAVASAEVCALCEQYLLLPPAGPRDRIEQVVRSCTLTTDELRWYSHLRTMATILPRWPSPGSCTTIAFRMECTQTSK
jgi:hypothetical protein